ncbi:MAG: iron ABC transporter permease [Spirochaetaceae bacterium]|nr:MAG: iron ABC transporter permease [Spirochaetaceae bacterium]
MLLPLVYLVIRAAEADPSQLAGILLRPRNLLLLRNTILLTLGVLATTTVVAVPLAWLVVRTDLPAKRVVTLLCVLPLSVPGYVMAFALLGLGGNMGFMARVFGIAMPRPSGYWGAMIALSLYCFPYLFLGVRSSLMGLDAGMEESARSLGYSPRAVVLRVILPHLRPALVSGWLIVAIYVLGDFGAIALMRYEVFSYAIYTQYAGAFDRVYAAWLSLMLLGLALVPVVLEGRLLRGARFARTGTGVARRTRMTLLGRWKPLALAFLALVFTASIGLPFGMLAYWLTLRSPWPELPRVARAFLFSAGAAAPAAILAVLVAVPIVYLRVRYPSRLSRAADRIVYVGYALPPLALALAMVFFSLRAARPLYQSLPLLITAYVISFLALATGPIRASLLQAPHRLEEAARSLGCSPLEAFGRTVVPLLRRGMLASMVLVFVIAMKELPITFLLAPTGYLTLSVAVFSRTSEALLAEAAPYAAAIVLFSSLFVGLLLKYEGRKTAAESG